MKNYMGQCKVCSQKLYIYQHKFPCACKICHDYFICSTECHDKETTNEVVPAKNLTDLTAEEIIEKYRSPHIEAPKIKPVKKLKKKRKRKTKKKTKILNVGDWL